ncbi:hypothetical protein MPER_12946 [Moniliophthora perniciosa FA553]|nr:hypothetical protein MPER_12946 [Moniliophthora perniciosa FA553]
MPRERIHLTPEQKHLANNEKSKRWYQRNKDALKLKRQQKQEEIEIEDTQARIQRRQERAEKRVTRGTKQTQSAIASEEPSQDLAASSGEEYRQAEQSILCDHLSEESYFALEHIRIGRQQVEQRNDSFDSIFPLNYI